MTHYICPMHKQIREDSPGLCPICGMNLVPAEEAHESEMSEHAGHDQNIYRTKFFVSAFLSIPIVLIATGVWKFSFGNILSAILGTAVFFYCGWLFLVAAVREIKGRVPGMMTLIALAISVAYLFSVYAVIGGNGMPLFAELTTLIAIMLLGHWIEMRAVTGAQKALGELSKLIPETAIKIVDGKNVTVSVKELSVGDMVMIQPGSKVPADGEVIEGSTEMNESLITGEFNPVPKSVGSEVIAGSINGDGVLRVKVSKVGNDTFLESISRLVREAQGSKSQLQLLSDRAAFVLTIVAILVGTLTFIVWMTTKHDFSYAIERAVAVLVITCPHALGLAIPLVVSISTTLAAKSGILVKKRDALENARNISMVVFDKTGTLTHGQYSIRGIWPETAKETIIRTAAALDIHSSHPVAKAIVDYANTNNIKFTHALDVKAVPGQGIAGVLNGEHIFLGGNQILEGAAVDYELSRSAGEEASLGRTIVYIVESGIARGWISLNDGVRPESKVAVAQLKKLGIKPVMLTGDSEQSAREVAGEIGISEVYSGMLPKDKIFKIKELAESEVVAYVGDGINDAPALTQADIGVAIGAGTNVAIESAGIILTKNDPMDVVSLINLSRATYNKMQQNIFWATGYNVIAIPLAAGVLAPINFILPPALGAVFMSLSTVIVAVNALTLRNRNLKI